MKYIIEVEDGSTKGLYKAKGFNTLVFDDAGLKKLEPVSDALQHGYDEGYQEGLTNAWELAKKIILPVKPHCNNFTAQDLSYIFGVDGYEDVMSRFSASEVLAKFREYEEEQKKAELKVGDEIEIHAESSIPKMVVTQIDNQYISTVDAKGDTRCICKNTNKFVKTGRHFSQIEEVLEQMKGE